MSAASLDGNALFQKFWMAPQVESESPRSLAEKAWNAALDEAAKLCDQDHLVSGSNGPLMDHGYKVASEIHAKMLRNLKCGRL